MSEIISVIAQISALTFIIISMLAMGLSLTVKQIMDPLKNVKVVLLALLANFVLVPALAYLITKVIPLDDGLATGLIIVGTVVGAVAGKSKTDAGPCSTSALRQRRHKVRKAYG